MLYEGLIEVPHPQKRHRNTTNGNLWGKFLPSFPGAKNNFFVNGCPITLSLCGFPSLTGRCNLKPWFPTTWVKRVTKVLNQAEMSHAPTEQPSWAHPSQEPRISSLTCRFPGKLLSSFRTVGVSWYLKDLIRTSWTPF